MKRNYVITAEKALGHELPSKSIVHHVDCDRTNNKNCNLVVVQNQQEHLELHRKMRVRLFGGNPWTDAVCATCKLVKNVTMFGKRKDKRATECKQCIAKRAHAIKCKRANREVRFLTAEEKSAMGREFAYRRWNARVDIRRDTI